MKGITKKTLNFIQRAGGTKVLLKLAKSPLVNSLQTFWHKHTYFGYLEQYWALRQSLEEANFSLSGKDVLEIGAGGSIGVGYFYLAAGAGSWTASDLYSDLLRDKRWVKNEERFVSDLSKYYWPEVKKYVKVRNGKVKFQPPLNFIRLDVTKYDPRLRGKFDVILSQAVLEHIDRKMIPLAVKNLSRYLKKGGVMIHEVDLRDHMNVLNPFGFYQYDQEKWEQMTSGTIFYTNRLRASDFRSEFERCGLKTFHQKLRQGQLPASLKISNDFLKYNKSELKTEVYFTIQEK